MSQQPTFHITKEHFVGVINSLQAQFQKDKASAEAFGQIFNTNDAGFYDNSSLINAVFSFLHESFPKDDDGHCEIQFYCYTLNFGKNGEEYESPEELFDRLYKPIWNAKLKSTVSNGIPLLMDEAKPFPVHKSPEKWQTTPEEMLESAKRNLKHWQNVVDSKPSPDETH